MKNAFGCILFMLLLMIAVLGLHRMDVPVEVQWGLGVVSFVVLLLPGYDTGCLIFPALLLLCMIHPLLLLVGICVMIGARLLYDPASLKHPHKTMGFNIHFHHPGRNSQFQSFGRSPGQDDSSADSRARPRQEPESRSGSSNASNMTIDADFVDVTEDRDELAYKDSDDDD